MNIATAKHIRIDDYLAHMGYTPACVRPSGIWYRSMLVGAGCDTTPSLEVSHDGHAYHDWSGGTSGNIIDLALCIVGSARVSDALRHIEATMGRAADAVASPPFSFHPPKIEIVSVERVSAPALLAYARSRGISADVVHQYCREVHYRISDGRVYYALGWPNNACGYELRNRYAKLAVAPKDITVANDLTDCTVLVFEGFFDFLAAAQMGWFRPLKHNAVVLNSTSLVDRALPILADARRIICLLDRDAAGKRAMLRIRDTYPQAEDRSDLYYSFCDVNEFLMNKINYK